MRMPTGRGWLLPPPLAHTWRPPRAHVSTPLPRASPLSRGAQPYRLCHSYGVFPPHTAPPLKLIPVVEGSDDGGRTWQRYLYRYMLSGAASPPRWCAPHQPRLDYRMFYEGLGSTPDNLLAGTLALHEPYALSRAGFCDRLLQRLLEGDGPVSRLFGHNPFAGRRPTSLRMVLLSLEPAAGGPHYWREAVWGVHRPPVAVDTALWDHYCDEPEVLHWDALFFRRACAAHLGAADAAGGLAPTAVTFARPAVAYDGRALRATTLAISETDVAAFWNDLIGGDFASAADRRDWAQLATCVASVRARFDRRALWRFEILLSRYSAQLATVLAPWLWAPGWPQPTALQPPPGAPAVESWFDLLLVCHHIIGLGRAAFDDALADPASMLRAASAGGIWPDALLRPDFSAAGGSATATGAACAATGAACAATGTWDVVRAAEEEVARAAELAARPRTRHGGASPHGAAARALSVQSAAFLYVVVWWDTVTWHATKWRLCQRACSPWQLGAPRRGAGVLELVALVTHFVPAPEAEGLAEAYPLLTQGDDLLWRDESGRRLGH